MESFLTTEEPTEIPAAFSAHTRSNRLRIARACDSCSEARTRCNGDAPCGRCFDLHLRCRYDRQAKKRGRRSNASKGIQRRILARNGADNANSAPMPAPERDNTRRETEVNRHPAVSNSVELRPAPTRSRGNELLENFHEAGNSPSLNMAGGSGVFRHAPLVNGLNSASPCRYPCLEPLLPALKHIIPVEDACELLEIYFVDPGNSLFSIHSPYVLTPVLRKTSLLSPNCPRPTSPALLSTILWCMAHTSNISAFRIPGSRERIIHQLFSLSLSFFHQRDMDNWHRVPGNPSFFTSESDLMTMLICKIPLPGGWRLERDCIGALATGLDSDMTWTTFTKKPQPIVDDVLTLTLLTIVISGGEFKSDAVKWFNKAISLVKHLGYHSEATIRRGTSSELNDKPNSLEATEDQEERRRVFWLVYMLDRHLSLSFNKPLQLLDSECHVLNPLAEHMWQNIERVAPEILSSRAYGPANTISGNGVFEFFLPLMAILGDIIDLRQRRNHSRLGAIDDTASLNAIKKSLCDLEFGLNNFPLLPGAPTPGAQSLAFEDDGSPLFSPAQGSSDFDNTTQCDIRSDNISTGTRTALVLAYTRYIVHVLHVLLHSEWDAISMLEDEGNWIASSSFSECAFQAIAAAQAVSEILEIDPELAFMPYLFGIYLFHGSFVLLLFADRMPQVGPNASVEQACEVIIRAHEVCVVTLSTDFQRNFRKALRSTLYSVRFPGSATIESEKLRKEVLSMYRWTRGNAGLCL